MELRGIETQEVNQDAADGEMVKSEELIGRNTAREQRGTVNLCILGGESSSRSFSNPMFNIEPPANLYSEEPTKDITFGVENPTYVALAELDKGKVELDTLQSQSRILWSQLIGFSPHRLLTSVCY